MRSTISKSTFKTKCNFYIRYTYRILQHGKYCVRTVKKYYLAKTEKGDTYVPPFLYTTIVLIKYYHLSLLPPLLP